MQTEIWQSFIYVVEDSGTWVQSEEGFLFASLRQLNDYSAFFEKENSPHSG